MKSTITSLLIIPSLLFATTASADTLVTEDGAPVTKDSPNVNIQGQDAHPVIASKRASVIFDRPDINSEPAPEKKEKKEKKKAEKPKPQPEPNTVLAAQQVAPAPQPKTQPAPAPAPKPKPAPQPVVQTPQPQPQTAPKPKPKPQPAPQPKLAPVASTGSSIVSSAAQGQVGQIQDCTALVERALRAAGVQGVGDESPASLLRFGTPTSNPQPGDMIYYSNAGAGVPHIAIYIGGGKAVHGGWGPLGNQTVVNKANIGTGPVYYSVN